MAIFIGATQLYPSGVLPTVPAAANGAGLFNDGANMYWAYPGNNYQTAPTDTWRYRTIYTHGYIAAGYKGSNPWRSVNKTWHATDITVYCGEQLDRSASYIDGTFSDLNAYVHGTIDAHNTASIHTSSFSLFNGTRRTQNELNFSFYGASTVPYGYTGNSPGVNGGGNDAAGTGIAYGTGWTNTGTTPNTQPSGVGGWEMSVARTNHGCASAIINQAGYVYGGGTTVVNKMHFPTETMFISGTASPVTWSNVAAVGGKNYAYICGSSTAAGYQYMAFSNDTYTQMSSVTNAAPGGAGKTSDGYNKHLMTKYGHFYASCDTNTATAMMKCNDNTQSWISTFTKITNHGEENFQMGQDAGYCLGQFNGQQNNWTIKFTYSTDAMATLGFAAQPKGHFGTSSGCCATAAMTVVSQQRVT